MPILLFILVAIVFASYYAYRVAFFSHPNHRSTIDDPMQGDQYEAVAEHIHRVSHIMERIPCEDVSVISFDGCRLAGRYYHVRDGAPLEILFHGYRSCAFRDCSGGHALSRKMGFNALVVDQRAHGKSGGKTISFGIWEHRDCLEWIRYANSRFGCEVPIILSGLSMGAATVLMAAGLDLPKNVCCVIADSAYSSPSAIIEKVCRDRHYPLALCRALIRIGARLFGGFRLDSCTAKDAVTRAHIPILLIHGEDDRLVPCSMSGEIAAACSCPVAVRTFPGAGHGLSYLIDPLRYESVVYDFLTTVPSVCDRIDEGFLLQNYEN